MVTVLKAQRDMLKRELDAQNKWKLKPASVLLFLLGAIILVVWAVTDDGSTMSMLILLSGTSVVFIAILLYFLSPSRYLRSEVVDAMAISNVQTINNILSSLLIGSKCIYVPAKEGGSTKMFLPLSCETDGGCNIPVQIQKNDVFIVNEPGSRGVSLVPPGYGLYSYSKSIGAMFTDEGLENEIIDVVKNSLELASGVTVRRDASHISVWIKGLANSGMCSSIRKEDSSICTRIGCPVCSLIGCMIVDATGRKACIESVDVKGNTINVVYMLI
ncbi:hypothetical protein CUJ83_07715 [Methanocella sp. CWC-04]|uniref:DUF7982 domain-containing protein n=1 Tax=Methanooceanicella nereidis TaxID=2052831 RepID=A0AAP2W615_9EURY|nr:hypothetical protein [Methanocella sp. CWC-04]MCD1294883.1 hypothetical protein [Methanocella sp. CWC-04]